MRFGFLAFFLAVPVALAQQPGQIPFSPAITGADDIGVGRTLVLDASSSTGLGEDTEYRWYRDGTLQPISRSVEAVYTPEEAGTSTFRLIMSTVIDGERIESEVEKTVVFYERKIVLIAGPEVPTSKIDIHRQTAAEAGVYLRVLQPSDTTLPLTSEESLAAVISERSATLNGAEAIVLWTDGITGLQALMRVLETNPEQLPSIQNQAIVLITSRSLNTLARTVRGPFSVIRPQRILMTRPEALNPLLTAENVDTFVEELQQRDIDLLSLDESDVAIRPWNLLSTLVNYMLTHGVSSQVVILLLILPFIATIIAFLKQVIGMTTFGLFTPSIVALSFMALGWQLGVLFLVCILASGYATRSLMRRLRLLYVPKVAVILTVVSVTLLVLLGIGASLGITFSRDTVFVLLIMSTLTESFLNLKKEEGWVGATIGIGETILASLLCVFVVSWPPLQSLILAYPELIILTIFANLMLGRFTGLRLVEYFRFREVFRHLQEE